MIKDNIQLLINELGLQREKVLLFPSEGDFLRYDFDVRPEDFLEQAELDFESGGNTALLNSITNAKRATRSQIDKVVYCLGFDASEFRIKRKIELLKQMEIIAPRILRRVDEPRNLLEHEYVSPTIEEVEDALDLAALFIEATNRSINPIGSFFVMGNEDEYIEGTVADFERRLWFKFNTENKQFTLAGNSAIPDSNSLEVMKSRKEIGGAILVNSNEPMYIPIMRLAVVVERDFVRKTKNAIEYFFESLQDA